MNQQIKTGKYLARWIPWVILVLGIIGFADAAYLSAKHYLGGIPTCILFSGCDIVTTSEYATIGPISVALLGVFFYFLVLVLTVAYLDKRNQKMIKYLALLSTAGFLFSLYLLFLQAFVLGAWCIYCVASIISSTTIFLFAQFAWHTVRSQKEVPSEN